MKTTQSAFKFAARQQRAFTLGFTLCVLALTLVAGCRTVTSPSTSPNGAYISTTIVGQVTDESGLPLSGVAVTAGPAGSTVATTDANGLYALHNVSAQQNHAFVIAKKVGYFDGARAGMPMVNGVTYLNFSMATSASAGNVNAASGGTVTLSSGAKITLAPYGVVTSSGAAYNGTVTVYAKHFATSATNFSNVFPGDMTAQKADGTQTELVTYGIILAELHGSSGEILQPAPGSPATLTMPIAASQQSKAPASIPLLYFDETLGMWKEDGSAIKTGNIYSGTVTHFSCWNCDWGGAWGYVKGQIVCNDVPIPDVVVNLGGPGEIVTTDAGGYFTKKVPADASQIQISIQVLPGDNKGMYFTNVPVPVVVTPNNTSDLGQIALSSPCPSYLTGMIQDCGSEPLAGMVVASYPGGMSFVYTNDGHFKLFAGANTTVNISATAANGDVAQPQPYTAGSEGDVVPIPAITICPGASDIQADINGTFGSVLVFSQDGSTLATVASNGTDVVLLNAKSGSVIKTIPSVFQTYPYGSEAIQFSHDGTRLLTFQDQYSGSTGTFECWKTDGTKLTASSVSASSAIFTYDGKAVIYSSTTDKNAYLYNIASGSNQNTFTLPVNYYSPQIMGLTAAGSQFVAVAGGYPNSTVYIWDMTSNNSVSSFTVSGSNDSAAGVGAPLSPDGTVYGMSTYSAISFYNVVSGAKISTSTISTPTNYSNSNGAAYHYSYGISPDNSNFIAQYQVGAGNTVELLKMSDGTQTHLFDAPASGGYTSAVAISPDGKLAAAVYGTEIRVWKVN